MKKNTLKQRASKMTGKMALTILLIAAAVSGNSAKKIRTYGTETTVTVEVIK